MAYTDWAYFWNPATSTPQEKNQQQETHENLVLFMLCVYWEMSIFVFSLRPSSVIHTRNYKPNQFRKRLFPELMI